MERLFFAAVAALDQIADKQYSLAIPLYVTRTASTDGAEAVSLTEAVNAWRAAAAEADTSIDDVLALLQQEVTP